MSKPKPSRQCLGTTNFGSRCKIKVTGEEDYCHCHQGGGRTVKPSQKTKWTPGRPPRNLEASRCPRSPETGAHYWIIGPTKIGVCKYCYETREFETKYYYQGKVKSEPPVSKEEE